MTKNIEWKKSSIDYDKLNELNHKTLTSSENGLYTATKINKNQGKKNAESGHMKSIQPLGASLGGKIGGVITRDNGKLKQNGILGNQANAEKYGVRIYATNLNTKEVCEYISIREAERSLSIQAPIIRKILRGLQPKTRCGWTFRYNK
jgi:hypothetical protein